MRTLLWLDDYRDPIKNNGEWLVFSPIPQPFVTVWVKSYHEFVVWIVTNGLPDAICFDRDLGIPNHFSRVSDGMSKRQSRKLKLTEKTGYDCAKWLIQYCDLFDSPIPAYNIQSANPVGKANIKALLDKYSNGVI